jgi:hypothetical protein
LCCQRAKDEEQRQVLLQELKEQHKRAKSEEQRARALVEHKSGGLRRLIVIKAKSYCNIFSFTANIVNRQRMTSSTEIDPSTRALRPYSHVHMKNLMVQTLIVKISFQPCTRYKEGKRVTEPRIATYIKVRKS